MLNRRMESEASIPTVPRKFRLRHWREYGFGYLMILPAFGLTALFTLFPLVGTLYASFFTGQLLNPSSTFVGFQNFIQVMENGGFSALAVTFQYVLGFVALVTGLGLAVGLLLNAPVRGTTIFRTVFIVPLVIPVVATAIVWLTVFNQFFGIVDRMIQAIGGPDLNWFTPQTALLSVILFSTWWYLGHNVILFLAALKGMPSDVSEAAKIDGASPWERFRFVVLPLLMPSLALIIVISTVTALQTFTQVYVLTRGGPVNATTTAAYFIYTQAFQLFNTGFASAMGSILFVITIGITLVQMKVLNRLGAGGHY